MAGSAGQETNMRIIGCSRIPYMLTVYDGDCASTTFINGDSDDPAERMSVVNGTLEFFINDITFTPGESKYFIVMDEPQ